MSKFCMSSDEFDYDLGAQSVEHVNAQAALPVQLVLLSNNCVFLRKPNGYWKFPDADRVAYDEARQLQPMEDLLLESLGMSANGPLLQYAVCKAVRCNKITMRVVILKVQRDLSVMQFEGGAFVGLGDVDPHNTNFSATTAKILNCIRGEGWLEGLNVMQVSPSSSVKLPYRIILQCIDSKNIFLEPARVVDEKTGVKNDLGYSRLPGSTFETKQVAVAHAQALTCAIVGCVYSHEIWDVGEIRYVVVKVPGYGGQIRSDDHTATKYTYTFDDGKEGEGSFFSMEEILRSRGHVAASTQNSIANLLLDPLILKKH